MADYERDGNVLFNQPVFPADAFTRLAAIFEEDLATHGDADLDTIHFTATPWHEDSAFWDGRISTMAGIRTVWFAIDEATPANGSMGVIPGSPDNGFSAYQDVAQDANIFSREIKPELVDESNAVFFSLQPNACSLHEARTIHGAHANTSDNRRAGYTMRYFPTESLV